jgi:hypothetical protein
LGNQVAGFLFPAFTRERQWQAMQCEARFALVLNKKRVDEITKRW